MIIAVTGSGGFVGKNLIAGLKSAGHTVVPISRENGYDILDFKQLDKLPEFEVLIHLAAKNFVPESYDQPWDFYVFNFQSTLNVLELCRKRKARFILFSSYLYGNPITVPIDESQKLDPHNPYAQSKLIAEELAAGYQRDFNLPVIIFRPFNIYGSGQNENYLIPKIIKNIHEREIYLNDPRPRRDFIFIADVVSALKKAIAYLPAQLEIINLGYGESISIADVANTIKSIFQSEVQIIFSEEIRKNEVMDTQCDNSKCRNLLGWEPEYSFAAGVLQMKQSMEN